MNNGLSWWSELVLFLAVVQVFLLLLVWKLLKRVKTMRAPLPVICTATSCPHQEKIADLQAEIVRLKDAVLIATPVMQSHAGPSRLADFVTALRKRHGD